MVHLILPKRSDLSQVEHVARTRGMEHLIYASKDINDWTFRETSRETWMPLATHHIYEARDKKSGIIQPWQINERQADENGYFEREHMRIIEAFTESLLWLDQTIKEFKARQAMRDSRLALPSSEFNLAMAAKEALHRGDHPNSFK